MDLLLNKRTEARLLGFCNGASHAVLCTGPAGAGKATAARFVASQLLKKPIEHIAEHPYISIQGSESALTIDDVRKVKSFLRLKVPGKAQVNRIVILENVDSAGHEAQNALLKFIEEPPVGTVLILTASKPQQVLPTVRSRTESIEILPISESEAQAYFSASHAQNEVKKAFLLSQGYAGLMNSILNGEQTLLTEQIESAKQALTASPFERLQTVDNLAKDKEKLAYFLSALERICTSGLSAAGGKNNLSAIARWKKSLKAVLSAQQALSQNGNAKLVMTQLFLHL